MSKSADAFRTISEVAEWLGVQTHVLRFWESKFSQVRPVKRAGGRRYYRPADMLLLGGIRRLLHEDGLTIKGVQKVLREEGVAHVADLSKPLDELTTAQIDADLAPAQGATAEAPEAAPPAPAPTEKPVAPPVAQDDRQTELPLGTDVPTEAAPEAPQEPTPPPIVAEALAPEDTASTHISVDTAHKESEETGSPGVFETATVPPAPSPSAAAPAGADPQADPARPEVIVAEPVELTPEEQAIMSDSAAPAPEPEEAETLDDPAPQAEQAEALEDPAPAPKPHIIDVPETPALDHIAAAPGLLSRANAQRSLPAAARAALPDLRAQLAALRDRMADDAARPG